MKLIDLFENGDRDGPPRARDDPPPADINDWSDEKQIEYIGDTGYLIKNIYRPSCAVQISAIINAKRLWGVAESIQRIPKPCLEAQFELINRDPRIIKIMHKPIAEEIQLVAVRFDGDLIAWILQKRINPSLEVQLAAAKNNGLCLKYFHRRGLVPALPVQLAAVQQNGLAIQYIDSPSPPVQIQLVAVQQNGLAIQYIDSPSPLVQSAALKQNPNAIKKINPEDSIDPSLKEKYGKYLE